MTALVGILTYLFGILTCAAALHGWARRTGAELDAERAELTLRQEALNVQVTQFGEWNRALRAGQAQLQADRAELEERARWLASAAAPGKQTRVGRHTGPGEAAADSAHRPVHTPDAPKVEPARYNRQATASSYDPTGPIRLSDLGPLNTQDA